MRGFSGRRRQMGCHGVVVGARQGEASLAAHSRRNVRRGPAGPNGGHGGGRKWPDRTGRSHGRSLAAARSKATPPISIRSTALSTVTPAATGGKGIEIADDQVDEVDGGQSGAVGGVSRPAGCREWPGGGS